MSVPAATTLTPPLPPSDVTAAKAADRAERVAQGRERAREWLASFGRHLANGDAVAIGALFHADSWWRDMLALQWDFRTHAGRDRIVAAWRDALRGHTAGEVRLEDESVSVFDRKGYGESVEAFFTFTTQLGRCRGHLRLLRPSGADTRWNGWTLFTSLEDIHGHEELAGANRRRSTFGKDAAPVEGAPDAFADPEVLVLGAGQAGLSVAARLQQMDIRTLVVDKEKRLGDNWRNRYQSLLLHNQIGANHLPYLPFPSSWPAYLSKDEMADWLEIYASALRLNVSMGTRVVSATRDDAAGHWTVELSHADGQVQVIHPKHVIQATGVFGVPNRPQLPGAEHYGGILLHAEDYGTGFPAEGAKVLVIGSGSSGHDVAQNLHGRGARVTMLQRSSTCVVSVEPGAARAYSIYADGGPPVEDADFVTNSMPFPLLTEFHKQLTKRIAEMDKELLDGLARAGFSLDFGEDGSGFLMKYHRYGGGYYIDSGCSRLIVGGQVQVKHGSVAALDGKTVRFADGTAADFDAIVVAAGYKNMSESVRLVFGDAVADRVGPAWGLDEEGEVRAMWRPTGQPGFWLMGGSLQQCRPYSKYLAMQVKAALLGLSNERAARTRDTVR
ncbi:flavin-containing monooxygenase [Ramlibacter sp.]|uniref:flavin-containing monooxygenase n=1 Tax=Ramlibacter sp. TaxID=1917967 RepID=UPI003D12B7A9